MSGQPWTCQQCSKRLTGSVFHCRGCCESFTTIGNYDKHRPHRRKVGKSTVIIDHVICYPPDTVGLVANDRGYWHEPAPDVHHWEVKA